MFVKKRSGRTHPTHATGAALVLSLLLASSVCEPLHAQVAFTDFCATPSPTAGQMSEVEAALVRMPESSAEGQIVIPLVIVTVTQGSEPAAAAEQVRRQIDRLNTAFAAARVSFVLKDSRTVLLDLPDAPADSKSAFFQATQIYNKAHPCADDCFEAPLEIVILKAKKIGAILGASMNWPWQHALNRQLPQRVFLHEGALPGSGHAQYGEGKTAVHEVGHWLGLVHTFQNGCAAPGDFAGHVQRAPVYGCKPGNRSCGATSGVDPVHNFMSYSDDVCLREFSARQIHRIHQMASAFRPHLIQEPVATSRGPSPARTDVDGDVFTRRGSNPVRDTPADINRVFRE